ncbi:MAG: hypothetical protein WA821_01315 [Anaerolineales bacterium]
MRPGKPRWKWLLLAAASALLLIAGATFFVRQSRDRVETYRPVLLAQFTQNDVSTKIEARESPAGQMELLGTFTPTREHFHLYSKDLPRNGLNGLGRPTLLEVISSDGIRWTGALTAYQPAHDIYLEILGLSFPVYPEGPVMLGLPFELTNEDRAASMELSVTYMACSDQKCLPPVVDRRFTVKLPH